jgi:glycosyltransferase involved in cell wall biosynthesis
MITILVPAYNEEDVIERLVDKLCNLKLNDKYEVLIINDGSSDRTEKILKEMCKKYNDLRFISHSINKGLGSALTTGFRNARGNIVVTMDADLTHPLDVLPIMTNCIENGYDMCLASRYVDGGGMKNVPFQRVLLSKYVNTFFAFIYWTKIRDLTTGYRAYKTNKIKNIKLKEKGFAIQLEITINMLKNKAKIKEVPFVLVNRSIGNSKFNFFRVAPKYIFSGLRLFFLRWF